jgi:hypothetical protein
VNLKGSRCEADFALARAWAGADASIRRLKFRGLLRAVVLSTVLVPAQAAEPAAVEIAREPYHHLVLENEFLRVFLVEVAPHESTLLRRHPHDYISITLGDSEVSYEVEGKPPAHLYLCDSETYFLPGNYAHLARNLAAAPFRNLIVELLQDEKARKTQPPKWDEERGLQIFIGGTQDTLFVKDGVRVSEIELQPGATMPRHHHRGPHLQVALTDLEIRSDVVGQGPMPGHFKSRDAKWLPGGYAHTPGERREADRKIHNSGAPVTVWPATPETGGPRK